MFQQFGESDELTTPPESTASKVKMSISMKQINICTLTEKLMPV